MSSWLIVDGAAKLANSAAIDLLAGSSEKEVLAHIDSGAIFSAPLSVPTAGTLLRLDGNSVDVVMVRSQPEARLELFQAILATPHAVDEEWFDACLTRSGGAPGLPGDDEIRRGLFSSSVDCVNILDLEARLVYMNPRGRLIMGVADAALIQDIDWLSFWTGEFREEAERAFRLAKNGGVGRFVGYCPNSTGDMCWWDVVITPMRDQIGTVKRLLSVSRDVSEMKQAQLRETVERSVLEAASSTRPTTEVLNRICRLADVLIEGKGSCSLMTAVEPGGDQLTITSAPACPDLLGAPLSRKVLEDENHPQLKRLLDLSGSAAQFSLPLRGPDSQFLGMLVVWLKTKLDDRDQFSGTLDICLKLASVVFMRDAHLRRLRYKQERLTAISRWTPIGLYQVDAQGQCIYANERFGQMTGLSVDDSSGEGWLLSVHPGDRDMIADVWREARAAGTEFRAEYRLPSQGGERWVIAHETITEEEGRLGTITEITELKQALRAVEEISQRFQTLANNIPPFCWMADANGSVFWYNDRWFEYTGTTLAEMQGWGWRRVHHPDHVERVAQKIAEHWISGEPWEDTFPLRAKDGTYRWFLSRALPIRDDSGAISRWFGTNADITELRDLDAALQRQNMALQRSNEELSRFAFVASHDLQEPLRTIATYTQLIQRSSGVSLDEKNSERLTLILDAAGRMNRLIRDLLTYAQASSDTEDQPNMVPLDRVVATILSQMQDAIAASGAVVTLDPLPEVCGVESRLAQVIQNLLSNALKYRRPDVPLRIHIGVKRQAAHWRVSISDNGQGFDPAHAPRVFDFLKRLHGKDVPGSGIGLAICKTIIEKSGGEIGAEAAPGEGATFSFTLRASCVR